MIRRKVSYIVSIIILLSCLSMFFLSGVPGMAAIAVIYEAENEVTEGTATVVEGEGFPGGRYVTGIGGQSSAPKRADSWADVDSLLGGECTLRLCYHTDEDRFFKININDEIEPVIVKC